MRKPQAVIVGHVCIDHNVTEHAEYTNWGSTALYIADYYQQKLGITPDVVTTYGPDLLHYAKHFRLCPATPQAEATMRNENHTRGNKRIFYSRDTEEASPPEITPEVIELLQGADIFILASLLANYSPDYLAKLVKHTRPHCLRAITLQGYLREVDSQGLIHPRDFPEAATILPLFDLAVCSDDDHPAAVDIARTWKNQSPDTNVVVTEGPLGATVVQKRMSYNIPTTPVPPEEIIDSVGCGDVFSGALFYQYQQTRSLRSSVKAAHLAARGQLLEPKELPF